MLDEKYDAFQEAHVASQDIQDAAVRMEEVVYKEAPKKDKKNKIITPKNKLLTNLAKASTIRRSYSA